MHNFSGHDAIINTMCVNEDGVLFSGGSFYRSAAPCCARESADHLPLCAPLLAADNGSITLWDYATGKPFQHIKDIPHPGSLDAESGVFVSTFDKTGTRLITGGADKTIKVSLDPPLRRARASPIHGTALADNGCSSFTLRSIRSRPECARPRKGCGGRSRGAAPGSTWTGPRLGMLAHHPSFYHALYLTVTSLVRRRGALSTRCRLKTRPRRRCRPRALCLDRQHRLAFIFKRHSAPPSLGDDSLFAAGLTRSDRPLHGPCILEPDRRASSCPSTTSRRPGASSAWPQPSRPGPSD